MSALSEMPGASSSNSHLSYYTPSIPDKSASLPPGSATGVVGAQQQQPRELSKNRLYVGNLHPSVDEYTFLQVFNKFGKISKLDYLFHKSGPSRGKPRGYAFVEYKEKEDALKALVKAHDKLLRGRKIVVTYANQAPTYEFTPVGGTGKYHRRVETQRPTALSLIKATSHPGRMEDKIAAMEAKLRQMEKSSFPSSSTLPSHPSLPLKPPPSVLQTTSSSLAPPTSTSSTSAKTTATTPNPNSDLNSRKQPMSKKVGGIFASGSSSSLGKKPTLEELMKSRKAGVPQGLLKR